MIDADEPPARPELLPRRLVTFLVVLCGLCLLWTLYRGAVVRLEYFDGYSYLVSAKRLSGDRTSAFSVVRPPLIALVNAPGVALARAGGPANLLYTLAPHLLAALLSVGGALVMFLLFRRVLGLGWGLVGVAFFVTGRFFVHYGAFTMADLLATSLTALTAYLFLRAHDRGRWRDDIYCGLAFGLTIAAKYPLVLMGGVLALAELLFAVPHRRLRGRRVAGLALTGAVGVATFAGLMVAVYLLAFGPAGPVQIYAFVHHELTGNAAMEATSRESKMDYALMGAAAVAWPILILAVAGLAVAARQRRSSDLLFFSWLIGLAGPIVVIVPHTEARYLLPVLPPVLYFGVRGCQALAGLLRPPRFREALVAAIVLASSWWGLVQAWADSDPLFVSDVERLTARAADAARAPNGRLGWVGGFACLYPSRRMRMPADEFFNAYHYHTGSITYFVGQPVQGLRSLGAAQPGDAVVLPPPNCDGLKLPATPVGSFEIVPVGGQAPRVTVPSR